MQHGRHPRMSDWGPELYLGKLGGRSSDEHQACTSWFLDLPFTSASPSCLHLQPRLIVNLFGQMVLMLALLCSGGSRSRVSKNSHRMEAQWPWTPVLFPLCGIQAALKAQGSHGLSEILTLIRWPHAISEGIRPPWSTGPLLHGQRAQNESKLYYTHQPGWVA